MTKLLFIAPQSHLSVSAELARIASGYTPEVVDGLLDRAGLERALRADCYDALHFAGHGGKSVLELSDGLIDAADFVSMLDRQRGAKFAFVNACDSLAFGAAVHNALHIPVIAHDREIGDKTAVRFAERFYREYKRAGDVGKSFDAARETLMCLFPNEATTPVLLNGDMATVMGMSDLRGELESVFQHFNARLDKQDAKLDELGCTVEKLDKRHAMNNNKIVLIIIGLLTALTLLQGATPWLNAMLAK